MINKSSRLDIKNAHVTKAIITTHVVNLTEHNSSHFLLDDAVQVSFDARKGFSAMTFISNETVSNN